MTVDAELATVVAIARQAAELVRERYREHLAGGIDVELKGPGDPVTAADRDADELISRELARAFPGELIVSEESTPADEAVLRAVASRAWFVDPLDGTRDFVDRTGEFAVMIGLAEEGRALAGVVALPREGLVLAGRIGAGAVALDAASERALSVSSHDRFTDCRMVVSRSHRPRLIEPLRRRLGIPEPAAMGSVGVKVARLALDQADVYVHAGRGMKLWDACAPEAILAAAGGRVTDLDGAALDYTRGPLALARGFVASNERLHAGLLSAVGWAERETQRTDG